ncbi:MAG: outer membrane protein assembly factor [Chitinophagaceae bacterium]|nr:MAG: outer membrane protein assembly factor [Chitinophagaceae bacterium]
MQRFLSAFLPFAFLLLGAASFAQTDTSRVTSIDPDLLNINANRIPKEYTIRSIKVTGINTLDSAIVLSISGLQVGDKVMLPGGEAFSRAINNLWRQRLFANVQIFITSLLENTIDLEIQVQERPRLASVKFIGVTKGQGEELQTKINLAKSTIITENTKRNATDVIQKFFAEKGYLNTKVRIDEAADRTLANSRSLTFYIDKGEKVKVSDIVFYDNETVSSNSLEKQMSTKEKGRLRFKAEEIPSVYGKIEKPTLGEYMNNYGFLFPSKTKNFLEPYFRFRPFAGAKFERSKYEEDKDKILNYYNSLGYRDAEIVADTQTLNTEGNRMQVHIKVREGSKYYFGNIAWKGNTKYPDSVLTAILNIRKGDIYNIDLLNRRLGKQLSPEGGDISGLYMDDGYLFFRVEPVETAVYNDTIDYELRVTEGPQARIRNINITGNDRTKDYVIRRELRTVPGNLFSRSDLIRSQRELAALNFFNQEKINPNVVPNQDDGTVDITWELEEKSSDQLELSAGFGGGIGFTGTLGVTFNNFSIRNIFSKEAWDPLPMGDGQKLSLRYQSNGRAYRSYNFSFTEPWLGGKKRNSLTFGVSSSKFSNAYDYLTGRFDKARSDTNFLSTTSVYVSLGKQLKWPDDYFSLVYSLNYTRYSMMNYPIFQGMSNGTSSNFSLRLGLQRSSVFNPTFPTSGSNFSATVQLTPPYSLFNKDIVNSKNPYKNPEYHKWRLTSEWFVPLGRPKGEDKTRQFVLKLAAKYGFIGRYNKQLDFTPFERFQLGGDGLTNNNGILGYDIIALRGYPVFDVSDPTVNNPDQTSASRFFTIFNKYSLELRYPLVTNPGSTIYALTFFDAANGWNSFKDYNPFRLRRSVGVGMRFFLPMFGLLGFDYGIGLDRMTPNNPGLKNAARFTFMLGMEPE